MLFIFYILRDQIVVDGDWSTVRSYDNTKEGSVRGYNKLRPGKPCLQAIVYFVNGFCLRPELVGGKGVPIMGDKLIEHLQEVREQCRQIDWVRLDSGFICHASVKGLDDFTRTDYGTEKIRFIVNLKKCCQGATEVMRTSKCREWQKIKRGLEIQDHPDIQLYKNYSKKHRVVLVKEYISFKQNWEYYMLATNEVNMDAVDLYSFYHKRQAIENFFDEAKNSYFIENLPSKKLLGNDLYFNIICLVFNLLVQFRRDVLPQKHCNLHLRTLQKEYFDLELEFDERRLTIPRWIPKYRSLILVLQRLKKLNISVEYRICG